MVDPKSSNWCPYKKQEGRLRRRSYEDGGRKWSNVATNQSKTRIAGDHQKLEESIEQISHWNPQKEPDLQILS